jgi:hypothetical protein
MNHGYAKPRNAATAGLVVAGVVVVTLVISALAGAIAGHRLVGAPSPRRIPALAKISLPRPVKPAFVPSNPNPLSEKAPMARWAPVESPVAAREQPRPSAAVVTRLGVRTPEGTANIVSVLGSKARGHNLWVQVNLPVLPNGTTGWIPREALGGYGFVTTRLIIDLERFQMILYRREHAIFRAPVGVGKGSSPTPKGDFYIRDKVTDFDNPFYGPVAFGTSARSSTLTDWPAGGFIGIHGTNQPDLIPGAISHGCIRLTNRDIDKLARLMPVGTPVTIR